MYLVMNPNSRVKVNDALYDVGSQFEVDNETYEQLKEVVVILEHLIESHTEEKKKRGPKPKEE